MLKVLLTGIPSSGKTSVTNGVVERFTELGYRVLIVPETATEYINSGIKPFGPDGIDPVIFQELVLKKQLNKEALYEYAANVIGSDKTIIIFDRGTLDGYAYVPYEDMESVVEHSGETRRNLLLNYDVVLFLEGSSKFFTKENNKARYEKDAEEAASLRKNLLNAYLGHDNLRVIQTREEMKDKQEEVINIVANMLGKPTRIRNQKKFLVSDIDIDILKSYAGNGCVTITQDYLTPLSEDEEYRIRKIEQGKDSSYHFSVIKKHEEGKRDIIKEETISEEDYNKLLKLKNKELETIKKTRYSFVYANQYYKLDIFDDNMMVLEVNLTKENPEVSLPDFIRVLDDVTNDPNYTNINIAGRRRKENGKQIDSDRGHRLLREKDPITNVSSETN